MNLLTINFFDMTCDFQQGDEALLAAIQKHLGLPESLPSAAATASNVSAEKKRPLKSPPVNSWDTLDVNLLVVCLMPWMFSNFLLNCVPDSF